MAIVNEMFIEKYRPSDLKHIILSDRIKSIINQGKLEQNYLFEGSAGIGKTTLAKILAKNRPTKYINVSAERGIDTIRDEIINFCMTSSMLDNRDDYKVVVMDEFDGATPAFQDALRATMEKFHKTVRFIATCNYLNKIPDPIQSRFLVVSFNPQTTEEELELKRKYAKRIYSITKKLGIEWESKKLLSEFISRNFPDLRKTLNQIQKFKVAGIKKITKTDVKKAVYSFVDLYELLINSPNPAKNYKLLYSQYNNKTSEIFDSLNKEFPKWLIENHKNYTAKLPSILIKIPEWEYMSHFLNDPMAGLVAAFFSIQTILNT